jgi:beta-lactamase class C
LSHAATPSQQKSTFMCAIIRAAMLVAAAGMLVYLQAADADAADAPAQVASAVDAAFRPLLAQYAVPGIAVAVAADGCDYFFSYGVASKASAAAVTKDTLFEIGSVSKIFTATLACYAQAQGKLSLDDHPSRFMPALRGSPIDAATLLNLGTFTAGGLPLQMPDGVRGEAGMVTYFKSWKPAAPPGAQRQYSNPSIGLMGHLTALAMRENFADATEHTIFPALGMRHSYIRVPADAMGAYAWGTDKAGKPIRVHPGMFDAEAYGVKSSAADMIKLVEANIHPETLAPDIRRAVEGTQAGYFKSGELVQGLGWEQYPYPVLLARLLAGNADTMAFDAHPATAIAPPRKPSAPTLFNKTGSTNGFASYVVFVPQKKIGLVMLANRNFPIAARVRAAYAVLAALAAETP